MLKSVVWSYKNKQQFFVQKDRFYVINSHKELDKLIDSLMDIDAVTSFDLPQDVKFPIYVELENLSFGPSLIWVEKAVVQKAIDKAQKELKTLKQKGKLV